MGKRKKSVPKKVGDTERRDLTWNMMDVDPVVPTSSIGQLESSSLNIIADDDPALLEEIEASESSVPVKQRKVDKRDTTCELIDSEIGTSVSHFTYRRDDLLDIYNLHIQNCSFNFNIWMTPQVKKTGWSFEIGGFNVKFIQSPIFIPLPTDGFQHICRCTLHVGKEGEISVLSYDASDGSGPRSKKSEKRKSDDERDMKFWLVDPCLPRTCLEALKCGSLQVVIDSIDSTSSVLSINLKILGTQDAVVELSHPSVAIRPKYLHDSLKTLVQYFYGISSPYASYGDQPYTKKHDIEGLFQVVRDRHKAASYPPLSNVQHPDLLPRLRPYQQQAITWMVHQEKQLAKTDGDHVMYEKLVTKDGQTLYFNVYAGTLVRERPTCQQVPPGGILGDEMGLGKTVEVLACMLHHPRDELSRPDPLPVIPEDIEKEDVKKKKRKRKRRRASFSDSEDSDDTIEYTDDLIDCLAKINSSFDQSEAMEQSCETNNQSDVEEKLCDNGNQSKDHAVSGDQDGQTDNSAVIKSEDVATLRDEDKQNAVLEDNQGKAVQIEEYGPKDLLHPKLLNKDSTESGISCDSGEATLNSSQGSLCQDEIKSALVCKSESIESGIELDLDSFDTKDCIDLTDANGTTEKTTDEQVNSISKIVSSNVKQSEKTKNEKNGVQANNFAIDSNGTKKKVHKNIFTEQPEVHKSKFECVCGLSEPYGRRGRGGRRRHPVQCTVCRLWQHAECVQYDLQDPYRGPFKCPHCHAAGDPISSGATLIISPATIAHQWIDEIMNHVKTEAINVMLYEGVSKQRYIQPRTLAKQDIVITTYETLRKEIDYVDLPHSNSHEGRKLRHPKRFMAIPSPITAVQWWRVCLDEAQMVECTTTKTAEMALRLSAINRWCVTGTPVQKSIDDLYGLLLFLGVDPYWVHMWWVKMVYDPYCHGLTGPMHDLLTSVLWRTVKPDVLDQIDIPEQGEDVHWLNFSPVEEHFYRRQYKDCVKLSMQTLRKWTDSSVKLCNIDRATVSQMLYPLVRLRQACCHPQVVRGEFLPLKKDTMTMDQLLDSLIKKATVEAEESHRALVAAMNGQAGLAIINEKFASAVDSYREVLRSVEEQKHILKTDKLQQLHAMYNLNEILQSKPAGVHPTLRDDLLPKQVEELRDHYLTKAVAYLHSTEEALAPAQIDVKLAQRELGDGELWFLEVIQWAGEHEMDEQLLWKLEEDVRKDKSHFDRNNRERPRTFLERHFNSTRALQYALDKLITEMKEAYRDLQKSMAGLHGNPTQELINQTVECCLRPVAEVLNSCPFCKTREVFETYESKIFSFIEKDVVRFGPEGSTAGYRVNREGTWADSDTEKALKSLLSFAKLYRVSEEYVDYGTSHLKLLDAMKKEYKKLRANWAGKKEHVATFDELDMSTTRLRLRLPDEPVPETPQLNVLERSELSQHELKLSSDRIVANGELRKKLGQLLYLTNLAKNQLNTEDGSNPDPCPICQQELGKNWSVMQCGHCFCMECVRILQERASFGRQHFSIKCPVCRQPSHQSEISYVVTTHNMADNELKVKGSHSTKVEAVVRCLLQIKKEDPQAKSLVFSTWTDVLSVIARALTENDLKYRALYTAGKFQENLASFKQDSDETILLLPVHSGANGLNLIEATHVLLVEPILNPAQELQAIGRVHRIGQTRPTCVHRFLTQNTIEQKMYTLVKSMEVKASCLKDSDEMSLTIGDLTNLFVQHMEPIDREGVTSPEQQDNDPAEPGMALVAQPDQAPLASRFEPVAGPSWRTDIPAAISSQESNLNQCVPSQEEDMSIQAELNIEDTNGQENDQENGTIESDSSAENKNTSKRDVSEVTYK